MTTEIGFTGYAPEMAAGQGNPEALKYGKLWERPEYRVCAPGESLAHKFFSVARPKPGSEVLDLGCGTGRGAMMLALFGMKVTMIDFVRNSLDPEVKQALETQPQSLSFVKADLEQPLWVAAPYGFCTDVMEHIPPEKVDRVLDNILHAAEHVFFAIATIDDTCGEMIGEKLHLTVEPYTWWLERFKSRDCVIHYSEETADGCIFYVSAWTTSKAIVDVGDINIGEDRIHENVRHNIAQGWAQVTPYPSNDFELMILGGGPSLSDYEDEIRERREKGEKLVTLNGTYNWAVERGIIPSATVVVDARAFNARFTKPVVPNCRYLISSQCDPATLEGLPKDMTFLWHPAMPSLKETLDAQYNKIWFGIPGGSTVLLRSIPLLRMLGYRKFILYGCDSCVTPEKHHAYAQPENDRDVMIPVTVSNGNRTKIFHCTPWQVAQAHEFMNLIKFMGDEIELEVLGPGLLAHIINIGAELADLVPSPVF